MAIFSSQTVNAYQRGRFERHLTLTKADWSRSFAAGTSSIIVAVKQLHTDLGEVYRNRERLTMLTDHPNLVKCSLDAWVLLCFV
jgi:hypothetical protein